MIFDANILFGFDLEENVDLSIQRTLELMDSKKIAMGLISNLRCKFSDFILGNDETASICNKYENKLMGLASFNQSQYSDVRSEVKRALNDLNLCGIRIYFTGSNFTSGWGGGLNSLVLYDTLDTIKGSGKIVFIEAGYPFIEIKAIAAAFPDLNFIASGAGYGNMGEAIVAAKKCNNLFLEISALDMMEGVVMMCSEIGSNKIIFGTGIPYNSPSSEILMVSTAQISQEDKDNIYYNNLWSLIKKA